MAGFGNGRDATGYHDQLWARGVVVDGKGGRIAIVTLDVIGYFLNEVETIRAMIAPESGIDYAVVTSTHQHEGPDTLGLWGPDELTTGIDYGYLDFVNAAVADCIDEAAAQSAEGARPLRHHQLERPEPRARSRGRRFRRRGRQGARRRRRAGAGDRRPHRRPHARADAVHHPRRAARA